jgi:hypothetical protein
MQSEIGFTAILEGPMAYQFKNLTKEQFLQTNKKALLDQVAATNGKLGEIHGAAMTDLNQQDFWVLLYIEAGLKKGKVDPTFRHSEGERGLFPLPANVKFWNGPGAPKSNELMPLETNIEHCMLYLGQLKNKNVRTNQGRVLFRDLFKAPGISGHAERETKVLAGVVHGYFTSSTYSNRKVPFDHLLEGFARDVALPDLMRDTKYRHAGSKILVNRQRNIDAALALI